ncbi:hypothetical protein HH214_15880 [Mucilaginibacter robiniae]|uniref:Uncharacterized protein n=1 Tax=Mucilaginibacter robiniae TaxID=2728022 RepID=A0A7L5E1K3_9SPHI|nr:hypothetical protein [Mucilaginibacter robiniae]QJD97242.1 hypothetical protein HH214_15880 [Mucilaginibacter robiniae]
MQRRLVNDYRNDVVDSRFTKTLVSRVTGFEGERLSDFIFKYRPAYDFVVKASDYDLMVYIKQKMLADAQIK